jgi:RNA polymerase sigma-70 factor (ECF subfamily)
LIGRHDHELVRMLQQGDLEALGHLYDRFQGMVYKTALGISRDPEEAADLLQDVFLRLYRFAERIDPDRPLEPWLYRMTANLAYARMRRRSRLYNQLKDWAHALMSEGRPPPGRVVERNEQWRWLERGLAGLGLHQRIVLVLYYINELSLQEIAGILEIPVGTAKSRLYYGRKALKRRLGLDAEMLKEVQYEMS